MGKIRRYRKKLHSSANESKPKEEPTTVNVGSTLPTDVPNKDLFKGIGINFASLEKAQPADDVLSLKSSKSLKSVAGATKVLSKKQKFALRRVQLLRKIDTVNQLKKERKMREVRKTTAIIGDTNPLHDALPSLQDLLKNKDKVKISINDSEQRSRGIEKAKKRKKKMIQGITLYKQILNNKVFQKSPLSAISEHIKHKIQQETSNKKVIL